MTIFGTLEFYNGNIEIAGVWHDNHCCIFYLFGFALFCTTCFYWCWHSVSVINTCHDSFCLSWYWQLFWTTISGKQKKIPDTIEKNDDEEESFHRVWFEEDSEDGGNSEESKSFSHGKEEDPFSYPTNNDYFTSDYNYNYNSYYSQLSAEAMAGDWEAISEMREEFGDDWEGVYS